MGIKGQLQALELDAIIELFVLDLSKWGEGPFYFHAGTNEMYEPVIWQGNSYTPLPVEISDISFSSDSFPRPKLKVANIDGVFSSLISSYDDLVGCKITRKRTLRQYLDAANFEYGNDLADPTEEYPEDIFYIRRKSAENKAYIEFECASALDLAGVSVPNFQCVSMCQHIYRDNYCGYSGGAVATSADVPTTDITKDSCSHKVSGCKLRFGATAALPFGGFVGASMIDG